MSKRLAILSVFIVVLFSIGLAMVSQRTEAGKREAALALAANAAAGDQVYGPVAKATPPDQEEQRKIDEKISKQIEAMVRAKKALTPEQQKIDSRLLQAIKMNRGEPIAEGIPTLETGIVVTDGYTDIEIRADVTQALLDQLTNLNAHMYAVVPQFKSVTAGVPITAIDLLSQMDEVRFIGPREEFDTNRSEVGSTIFPGISTSRPIANPAVSATRATRTENVRNILAGAVANRTASSLSPFIGAVVSEGDITHRANVARAAFSTTGAGVKIGVLSDGVNTLATRQMNGELPAVTVLAGQAGSGDEGTAMLEIVSDVAPGAQLYFATANPSSAQFAANIIALRAAGCDIIIDDISYFAETPFQDGQSGASAGSPNNMGVVVQAVNQVTTAGALYFSSAGNSGNVTDNTSGAWEGNFSDSGANLGGGDVHDFGGGNQFTLVTRGSSNRPLFLKWSDPLALSGNDYDLYLYTTGGSLVASSAGVQNGNDDPIEAVTVPAGSGNYRAYIVRYSGSTRFLHLNANRNRLSINTPGVVYGHNAGRNTISCAATPASGPFPNPFTSANVSETFTSDGPRRIFYTANGTAITPGNVLATGGELLMKPDITAADGVTTTTPGFIPFFGTSASAPHAGALIALLKQASPASTNAQLYNAMTSSAIDIEAGGWDRDTGYGIFMPIPALVSLGLTAPTTTSITSSLNPSASGASVTFTATTLTTGGSFPVTTGTTKFIEGGTCGAPTTTLQGPVAVNASGVVTFTTSALSVGSHTVVACYTGAGFGASNGSVIQLVNKADTTTALISSVNPSVWGQPVLFTATISVTAPGSGTPTGNVSFRDNGVNIGSCAAQAVAAGMATCSISSLSVSSHPITAVYNGDGNFNASPASNTVNQVVNKADTATTITTDLPDPSVYGETVNVKFTVVAVPPGAGTPTGNVVITVSGGAETCTGTVAAGSCLLTLEAVGSRTLTASYVGDANFNASSDTEGHIVLKANTATKINSDVPDPTVFGQPYTINATVTPLIPVSFSGTLGAGDPTYNRLLSFTQGGTCSLSGVGTAVRYRTHPFTLTSSSNVTLSTSPLDGATITPAGADTFITLYGPGGFNPATPCTNAIAADDDTGLNLKSRISTTTPLAAGNYTLVVTSFSNLPADFPWTYTAVLVPAPLPPPADEDLRVVDKGDFALPEGVVPQYSGRVLSPDAPMVVQAPSGNISVSDGTNLCVIILPATSCVMPSTSVGAATLTATYSGNANFNGSTAPTVPHTVNKADSATTVQTLINAPNYGSTLTATATITAVAPGSGTPQGTVNFNDGGNPIAGCQNVAVTALGSAVCTTNQLPAGVGKVIQAVYSGNANYLTSNGSTTQTIGKAPLNVAASSAAVTYGDAAPAITAAITGFVLGETTANLTTQPTCSTTYVQGSPVSGSQYPSSCTGAVSNNYSFNYVNGNVTVNKKGLTVTADNKSRAYGAANPTLTATFTGFVLGQNLGTSDVTGSPLLSTTATPSSPVAGSPYAITAALGTLASGNYAFTSFVNGILTITQSQLTVTANNQTRVFGAANPALTFTITGFQNGETLATSGVTGTPNISTSAVSTSAPGAYPITAAQGTLAAPNYTFATANGTLTVTQAATTTTITNASALGNSTVVGQNYPVNWTTSPVAPGAGTPTGNVTVSDGTGNTCTAAVAAGTCSLASTLGPKTITATYAGDANFGGSTSQAVQHNVVIGLTGNVKQFIAFGTNTNLPGVTMTLLNTADAAGNNDHH